MNDKSSSNYIELTADIVSAYVSNNTVATGEISALISQVHSALLRVSNGQTEVVSEALKPAIPVKKSITPDYLICLEDGKKFKSLKRHLRTQYNMTPEHYREKWASPAITRWWPRITPKRAPSSPSRWASASSAGVARVDPAMRTKFRPSTQDHP